MRVEIVEGLFLGKVFPVLEIGQGDNAGQYLLHVDYDEPLYSDGQKRVSWFDAERCRFVSESGYKQMTVDDAINEQSPKISRNEALDALVTLGKITSSERLKYIYEKELLDVARCNFITDMLTDFMSIGEPKVKRGRGQRGKGKKEAAVPVSLRIPADVLKMIDTKAAFNGMDRTAMILSILSKGY